MLGVVTWELAQAIELILLICHSMERMGKIQSVPSAKCRYTDWTLSLYKDKSCHGEAKHHGGKWRFSVSVAATAGIDEVDYSIIRKTSQTRKNVNMSS